MVIFLGIGILSIFGWIACCFCNCYDCCCCCCCKKKTCKIPCFIFSYLFYGLAVAVCLYGLTQSNKIFTGLANTECSLLQFFDQILYGEEREEQGARWAGIEGIVDMIKDLNSRITELAGKACTLDRKLSHMSMRTTREKLMSYLTEKSKQQKSDKVIIPFNRQELADYLCVDRSAMSKELHRMKRDGLIDFSGNTFYLK